MRGLPPGLIMEPTGVARLGVGLGGPPGRLAGSSPMDLPLFESDEIPLPPEKIRFKSVRVSPYPDRTRVRLDLRLTPFLERPNIDIVILDSVGDEAASAKVIENLDPSLRLTLHLRPAGPPGAYTARLALSYPDQDPVDQAEVAFELKPAEEGGA